MLTMTVEAFLDRSANVEQRLEAYYADVRDRSTDNSVRLLTYYLARHRHHQQVAMEGIDDDTLQEARKVKVNVDDSSFRHIESHTPDAKPETMSGKTLIEAAISYDNTLLSMYRSILTQPLQDDVHAILEALIRVEERDIVLLKKMLDMQCF